ncbi:SGNH hydrolase-type esterase domain-containing protein [Amylocarpus encephaloides]|uniref:SGNH hydrolase-type esterase domain-containing protein n=1 Tax=Amylocarpus encephaloides TaxID=45428 RepID=A0A9P7Y6S4_9HELO|nr:SGNH hydrolase-type esterase domain-containing protein [Amylocarpus encephaloides]
MAPVSQLLSLLSIVGTLCTSVSANVLPPRQAEGHWVSAWTSMPQLVEPNNLPPSPFKSGSAILNDATLRQTLYISLSAPRIRLQISNTFGGSDLSITSASLALPVGNKAGVKDIIPASLRGLTFNGGASGITIPRGKTAYTDAINFEVKSQGMVSLSLYLAKGQSGTSITGHPGSRTTSWMASGAKVNETSVGGGNTKHWYFVSAVEAWAPSTTSALVILGDSITDGRGSTDDGNNRWPDLMLARMAAAGITNIGVNNQAAGGNSVLSGGLGPPLLQRYTRDAITQQGVKWIMIFEGVNDIGGGGTDSGSQTRIGDSLISAFKQIASDAHKAGLLVIGCTITPFGGNGQGYSNPEREKTRQRVNKWILNSGGVYDGVVDFDKAVRNEGNVAQLGSQYDGGDHLHPNVAGYTAMAEAVDLTIFK